MNIQDVAALIGAITGPLGVILAGVALWAWRLQVRGTSRHEAAKRVLSAMHSLDEAINLARGQLVIFKAIRDGRTLGAPPRLDPYKEARRVAIPVWEAHKQLQNAEYDAYGPIGQKAKEELKRVYQVADLFMRQFHVEWMGETPEERRERIAAVVKWNVRPRALYEEEPDDFKPLLEDALGKAEKFFRSKL